jgi:serine O-acetyltransferase
MGQDVFQHPIWSTAPAFLLLPPSADEPVSYRPARRDSLALEDDQAMNEVSVAALEIAASRQRDIPADEGKLWETLRLDAERAAAGEEMLRSFLDLLVLRHDGFASGLGLLLAHKLAEYSMPAERLGEIARAAMADDPGIIAAAMADLVAIRTRDPATENCLNPFLYYKGFHALQWHRIGHWLWGDGRRELAHFLQSRVSEVFAVDIHPAVPIGSGVFIDHGTGLVVGETAFIGDDVSILHEVTLGGTGKERGNRHPKAPDRSHAEGPSRCRVASRMPGGRATGSEAVRQPRSRGRGGGPQSRHGGTSAYERQDFGGKHRSFMPHALEGAGTRA